VNLERIASATVRLRNGQGVLIEGQLILTAAHCLNLRRAGKLRSEDEYTVRVITRQGHSFRAEPIMVEPIADIAILQPFDGSASLDQFKNFWIKTRPVSLSTIKPQLRVPFPISIHSHLGVWITGAGRFENQIRARFTIHPERKLAYGTSGGPIVDQKGNLLGVVATGQLGDGHPGRCAFASRVLPKWMIEFIGRKSIT
jgi:Trypsin-like peptidase domain